MQAALDMSGGFGQRAMGQGGFAWFIAISLLVHGLLAVALYKVEPGSSRAKEPEAVIVRLFDLPPLSPAPIEAPRPAVQKTILPLEQRAPDVIDAPVSQAPVPAAPSAPSDPPPPFAATTSPEEFSEGPGLVRRPAIERLFDPGVIAEQARGRARSEEPGTGITFDTKDMMLTGYMGLLRDKIEGIWVYPRKAAEEGIYGDLIIRFAIRRDGRLAFAKVLRTSGHALLDEAALKALRDAGPYWPLPEAYRDETLVVTGRFIYALHGTYIR